MSASHDKHSFLLFWLTQCLLKNKLYFALVLPKICEDSTKTFSILTSQILPNYNYLLGPGMSLSGIALAWQAQSPEFESQHSKTNKTCFNYLALVEYMCYN